MDVQQPLLTSQSAHVQPECKVADIYEQTEHRVDCDLQRMKLGQFSLDGLNLCADTSGKHYCAQSIAPCLQQNLISAPHSTVLLIPLLAPLG